MEVNFSAQIILTTGSITKENCSQKGMWTIQSNRDTNSRKISFVIFSLLGAPQTKLNSPPLC